MWRKDVRKQSEIVDTCYPAEKLQVISGLPEIGPPAGLSVRLSPRLPLRLPLRLQKAVPGGALLILATLLAVVQPLAVRAQTAVTSPKATSLGTPPDELRIAGSRLLTPASFGFENIPTAETVPTTLTAVETRDEFDNPVVARVHVQVGENFVVMLPNGQLVGRLGNEVAKTDKPFAPASHKAIASEALEHRLANFANMKYEKSNHYVFLFNTSPAFKKVTRDILESMFNGVKAYAGNMGVRTRKADLPLVVIMFRTEREFQAYRPMPRGVVAYYDMVSNHVVLHEESPLAGVRPDLAEGQLLSTIAHEGAHQILHNIGVQQRLSLWPMWLSEGLAEFFAPTRFGSSNRWKGAGDINDLRMFELEIFLQTRYIQGFDGRTLKDAVTARQLDSTGYATAWGMVHYLAKKKKKDFRRYVAQLSHLPPLRGMASLPDQPVVANLEHFQTFFGDNMEANEKDMVEYLTRLDYASPVSGFVHYVGMAVVPDGNDVKKYACFFHTREMVEKWRSVLSNHLSDRQVREARWDVQKVDNRRAATVMIRRFRR